MNRLSQRATQLRSPLLPKKALAVEESASIEETTTAEETSAAGEEGAPYALGNSADLKDWSINVTDVKIVDSIAGSLGSFSPKEEGNTYVQVFVTVKNTGKNGRQLSSQLLYR